MKKLIIALFSLLFVVPVSWASSAVTLAPKIETIRAAVEYHIPDIEKGTAAMVAYYKALKDNGGGGIYANQMPGICAAGGLESVACDAFLNSLRESFYEVCAGKKAAGNNYCVPDLKWVNSQLRQGAALAQMWARVNKGDTIACNNDFRTDWNDDYLACYSVAKPAEYYEFQFDDLVESNDADTEKGVMTGVCAIFGYDLGVHESRKEYWCQNADFTFNDKSKNTISKEKCAEINKVANEFGIKAYSRAVAGTASRGDNGYDMCYLALLRDREEIVNEYDGVIDNYVYSSGKDQTQLQASTSLDESIRMYAQKRLGGTPITSFKCDKAHRVTGFSVIGEKEDILTCHINGKRVDFVFDDLSQSTALWGSAIVEGSVQGMGCRAMGGIFDGQHCADLSQDMCAQVAQLNLADCPGCKAAYWDAEKKICMLPASGLAKNIKTTIKIATNTGVATVALVVTVASGGTVLMITAATAATVAAVTSDGVKLLQDLDASDWVVEMNKIQTPEQADKFLRAHLEEIMGADHLDEPRRNGLDEMLSRVLSKASDTYFKELVEGCINEPQEGEFYYDTNLPTCALNPNNGKNTKSTIIQVADAVQFIAGVVMIVAGLTQTVQTVTSRATSITDKIDDLKKTGWIYRQGQNPPWYNQTTKEVIDKLPRGVPGWDPNPALRGGGRWRGLLYGNTGSFTKKADLVRWITENPDVFAVVSKVWNPNWAVVAAGVADAVVAPSEQNLADVKIPDRTSEEVTPVVEPEETEPVVEPEETKPTVVPEETKPVVEPEETKPVVEPEETKPVVESVQPAPVAEKETAPAASGETARDIKTHQVDKSGMNTALVATAAIAGTIGVGWLIGGLIGKDDDKKAPSMPVVSQNQSDLEVLMRNAGGVIGDQNGVALRLVLLPTTVNSVAPIVTINGNAVVVVDYRGVRLPYYMNPMTMRWEPLLGIGANGGWFNVYPNAAQTGIALIDSIAGLLGNKLSPSVVSRYTNSFNGGISFPVAGPGAYAIINAEFVNGVVQTNAGVMTPSDQLLYNNNYNLIRTKLQ